MFSDSSVATVDDAETLTDAEWHDLITGEGVAAASPAGPRNPYDNSWGTYEPRHLSQQRASFHYRYKAKHRR